MFWVTMCPSSGEITVSMWHLWAGFVVSIATSYRLDCPGIESWWGGEIFRTCPDRPWGPSSLLYNGYRVFPGGVKSSQGMTLTPHPLLVPWSRKGRAIPLLPLWAVRPVQSLSACTREHFTFYFTFMQHWVFVTLCGWLSSMQGGIPPCISVIHTEWQIPSVA